MRTTVNAQGATGHFAVARCALRWISGITFIVVFFLSLPQVTALEIPKRPDGYVTDRAGLLSSQARAELEETLRSFEQQTSNQVIVVTFPSLEGENLEDVSMKIADAWKPGQKEKDNGVILLIFKNDRKIRIEVGYGLEGALPDALAGQIIRNEIAPQFKEGRYDEGIARGVQAIIAATKGEYKASAQSEKNYVPFFILLAIIFGMHFFFKRSSSEMGRRGGRYRGYYVPPFGGRSSFRGGGFGGFSGGGGGFGGGGASGGW